jgi:hypothetical protein
MNSSYFEVRFRLEAAPPIWPNQFVILSAFATTGEQWTANHNRRADQRLAEKLDRLNIWRIRVIGYSPITQHAEPSWAFSMSFDEACDLGLQFRQDALYIIDADQMDVSYCDHRRERVLVGSFRSRVDKFRSSDVTNA